MWWLTALLAVAVGADRMLHWPGQRIHCHVYCNDALFDVCRPINSCRLLEVASSNRREIVMTHNRLRRQVAMGGTKLPQAADMMYVTHDWNAEMAAEILAFNCNATFYASCRKTGLNRRLAFNTHVTRHVDTGSENSNVDAQLALAMKAWFGEVDTMATASIAKYDRKEASNATVLVSSAVVKVGCAVSWDDANLSYAVCAYFPAPRVGLPIYVQGVPCSSPKCDRCTPYAFGLCDGPFPFLGDTSRASLVSASATVGLVVACLLSVLLLRCAGRRDTPAVR